MDQPFTSHDSSGNSAEDQSAADGEPGQCTTVSVDAAPISAADVSWLGDQLQRAIDQLDVTVRQLSIVIVDDAKMAKLHRQFMNDPTTTDVLTFDLSDEASASAIDGEIYICHDEATRRAASMDHALRDELLLYALHGVLHLMGYDDHDPADHQRMHETEDRVLEAIGVGKVYAK